MRHLACAFPLSARAPPRRNFRTVAQQPDRMFSKAETADKVARVGLEAQANGKPYVISGFMNQLMKESQRMAPRSLVTKICRQNDARR